MALDHYPADPYASAPNDVPIALVEQFTLTRTESPHGGIALEIFLSTVRDRNEAYFVCPHGNYEALSWARDISLVVRASIAGEWTSCAVRRQHEVGYGPLQYGGCGDSAHHPLSYDDNEVVFELIPEYGGDIWVWAYLYVDGRFAPFAGSPASDLTVDEHGALRAHIVL